MCAVNRSDPLAGPLIALHVTVPTRYCIQRPDCDRKHKRCWDQLQDPRCDAWIERHEEQWQGNDKIPYTRTEQQTCTSFKEQWLKQL